MIKMDSPAGLRAIVLGAMALCLVACIPGAYAGQKEPGAFRVAIFDPDRARLEYKYVATAQKEFQGKIEDTDTTLKTWQANALLTEADQKKLAELTLEERRAGANFDNAKKAELKKLQDQSKAYNDEFTQLQANSKMLTPQQRERLNVLVRAASDTEARLNSTQERTRAELQKFDQEVTAKIQKDMREAIGKVAKEKGVSMVFSTGVAWYGDNDLTDAVVGALNKK